MEATAPAVSVLLPFTGEGEWLEHSVRSILEQTFTDFELLLIDNGNHAVTCAIARQFKESDRRVVLLHEPKIGIAPALNAGIRSAHGRYIARMDADDIAHPERLTELFRMLEADPQTGVVSSKVELFPKGETNQGFARYVEWLNGILQPEQHSLQRFIDSPVAHPSVMVRAELFRTHGRYSEKPLPEDYELWLRWMEQGIRFRKSDRILLRWRDHEKRLTRSHAHYSEESFLQVKMKYLAAWLKKQVDDSRPVVVCGSSPNVRHKIDLLESHGISIHAVTDVKEHATNRKTFIPVQELLSLESVFVLNLIARTDLREPIRDLLNASGKVEGADFLMAG